MKKILSIFLIFLILTSSTGIAMTTHYCGGHAMATEISLGYSHLDCGMEGMDTVPCQQKDEANRIGMNSCCDNAVVSSKTDTHNLQLVKELNLSFIFAYITIYQESGIRKIERSTHYRNYSPPLPDQDIQILHQSFLL